MAAIGSEPPIKVSLTPCIGPTIPRIKRAPKAMKASPPMARLAKANIMIRCNVSEAALEAYATTLICKLKSSVISLLSEQSRRKAVRPFSEPPPARYPLAAPKPPQAPRVAHRPAQKAAPPPAPTPPLGAEVWWPCRPSTLYKFAHSLAARFPGPRLPKFFPLEPCWPHR